MDGMNQSANFQQSSVSQPVQQPVQKDKNIFKYLFIFSILVLGGILAIFYFTFNNQKSSSSKTESILKLNESKEEPELTSTISSINSKPNSSENWNGFEKKIFNIETDLKYCEMGQTIGNNCQDLSLDNIAKIQEFYNLLSSKKTDKAIKKIDSQTEGDNYAGVLHTLPSDALMAGKPLNNGIIIFFYTNSSGSAEASDLNYYLGYIYAENSNITTVYQQIKIDETERIIKSLSFDGSFSYNSKAQSIYNQIVSNDNLD